MGLSSLLSRRTVWSIAVFAQGKLALPPRGDARWLMETKNLFRRPSSPHTRADPFLFSHQGRLWVFYETQVADDYGRIEVAELTGSAVRPAGVVLEESFHLSYPSILEELGEVFMLPESQGAGSMRLYKFENFPSQIRLQRTLLDGEYADPSAIKIGEVWYIFATTKRGLELFFTDDLLSGDLRVHPANPITNDPRFSRCGGVPLYLDGQLLRPAQDASTRYGGNLNLMLIETLSKTEYRETPYMEQIFSDGRSWSSEGGHHLSVARFGESVAVAVDGQVYDYWIHKILMRAWMMATGRKRR